MFPARDFPGCEEYEDPKNDPWFILIAPVLEVMPRKEVERIAPVGARSVQALCNGHWKPKKEHRAAFVPAFFRASGTSLLGLVLGDDIAATEPAADGLALLLRLVKQGVLKPTIGIEAPWTEVATIARQLIDRGFTGKAILHLPR